jgi:hypothetical protein
MHVACMQITGTVQEHASGTCMVHYMQTHVYGRVHSNYISYVLFTGEATFPMGRYVIV